MPPVAKHQSPGRETVAGPSLAEDVARSAIDDEHGDTEVERVEHDGET